MLFFSLHTMDWRLLFYILAFSIVFIIIEYKNIMKNVKKIAEEIVKVNLENEVIGFLKENPNPSDADLHKWAEGKGYDVHNVETAIYKLATVMVQFLTGGRANEKGVTKADVDSKQLAMGIKVEYEHTPNKETSERIALDHLAELKDYYTRLDKMESEAGVDH